MTPWDSVLLLLLCGLHPVGGYGGLGTVSALKAGWGQGCVAGLRCVLRASLSLWASDGSW